MAGSTKPLCNYAIQLGTSVTLIPAVHFTGLSFYGYGPVVVAVLCNCQHAIAKIYSKHCSAGCAQRILVCKIVVEVIVLRYRDLVSFPELMAVVLFGCCLR